MDKMNFDITGMSCSACSARIERTISRLEGIENVNVNLLTNSMSVAFKEGQADAAGIIKTVENLGYGAREKTGGVKKQNPEDSALLEARAMKNRLIVSIVFAVPLFYVSMGRMLGWPLPGIFPGTENAMVYSFTLFLLTIPILFAGRRYFRAGFGNLFHLSPNMDSLIAMGSGAAVLYGVFAIYKVALGFGRGDMEMVNKFSMDIYFESAGMILTLITLGKYFEARAKKRTSSAITKLMDLSPKTAIVFRGGLEQTIPASDVISGDIVIVKEGAAIPADGILTEGDAAVDESAITG